MAEKTKLRTFLKDVEGASLTPYEDIHGNPTIGVGAKLDSPELKSMGIHEPASLTEDQMHELLDRQLATKRETFQKLKEEQFPLAHIEPHEEDTLLSLVYQNKNLVGPDMQRSLNTNQKDQVAKEILLRSNKNKIPGIQKRRLMEAQMYSGSPDAFNDLIDSLSTEEISQIQNIMNNMQNKHELLKIQEQYPFLRGLNEPRFKRLIDIK